MNMLFKTFFLFIFLSNICIILSQESKEDGTAKIAEMLSKLDMMNGKPISKVQFKRFLKMILTKEVDEDKIAKKKGTPQDELEEKIINNILVNTPEGFTIQDLGKYFNEEVMTKAVEETKKQVRPDL